MKKTEKTENVVKVFNLIKNAKYSKMSDTDKLVIYRIFKAIKKLSESFTEEVNDAQQRLIPYETFMQDLQTAQAYEIARSKKETFDGMTEEEYNTFIQQFTKYNQLVKQAVKESAEKEVEIEFDPLTAEGFDKLRLSNDWTFAQADEVESFVCE